MGLDEVRESAKNAILARLAKAAGPEAFRDLSDSLLAQVIKETYFPHMPTNDDYSARDGRIIYRAHLALAKIRDEAAPHVIDFYAAHYSKALSPTLDISLPRLPESEKPLRVLNAGVGLSGIQLMKDKARYGTKMKLFLGDNDPMVIAVLKRFKELNDIKGVYIQPLDLIGMQAGKGRVRDGYFDHISLERVLHHVDDLGAAVRDVSRVLRPGGTLHVMDLVEGHSRTLDAHEFMRLAERHDLQPDGREPNLEGKILGLSAELGTGIFHRVVDLELRKAEPARRVAQKPARGHK